MIVKEQFEEGTVFHGEITDCLGTTSYDIIFHNRGGDNTLTRIVIRPKNGGQVFECPAMGKEEDDGIISFNTHGELERVTISRILYRIAMFLGYPKDQDCGIEVTETIIRGGAL